MPTNTSRTAGVISAQAAVARVPGQAFSIENITVAAPRGDEIRVKIVGAGICHTDLVCRDAFPVPMPIVLGHEGAGIVEAVGPDVRDIKTGDHVVLTFTSCHACPNCREHMPAYCYAFNPLNLGGPLPAEMGPTLAQDGKPITGRFFGQSSFASYAIAHESNAVCVAKDLPLAKLGPLGCGIQTGAGAVLNSLAVKTGTSLAIFGGGAVGLSALMAAVAVDAGKIVVVEPNRARRALATELGAHGTLDPIGIDDLATAIKDATGGGVQRAFDTTGIPAVIGAAADSLLPNGILGLVGASPMEATLPINIMGVVLRGIGVKGILEGDSDPKAFIPKLLAMHRAGRFPFERLIQTFPFAHINEAVAATTSGKAIKPVLAFD